MKYLGFNIIIYKKLVKIEDVKKYKNFFEYKFFVKYRKLYGFYYIKFKNHWYVDLDDFFKQIYEKKYDEYLSNFYKKIKIIKRKCYFASIFRKISKYKKKVEKKNLYKI